MKFPEYKKFKKENKCKKNIIGHLTPKIALVSNS